MDHMKRKLALLLGALLVAGVSGCASWTRMTMREIPRMEPGELNARLDDPNLVVVDVRLGSEWDASPAKIKGAVHEIVKSGLDWASTYLLKYPRDKTIVLYCA